MADKHVVEPSKQTDALREYISRFSSKFIQIARLYYISSILVHSLCSISFVDLAEHMAMQNGKERRAGLCYWFSPATNYSSRHIIVFYLRWRHLEESPIGQIAKGDGDENIFVSSFRKSHQSRKLQWDESENIFYRRYAYKIIYLESGRALPRSLMILLITIYSSVNHCHIIKKSK